MASCFRVGSELEFPLFGYNFPPNFSIPPTPPPPACCRELLKSSFTSPSLRRPSVPRFLFLPHPAGNRVADVLMGFHSPPLPPSLPLCSAPQLKAFFSHFFLLALTSSFFALLIRISVPAYNTGTSPGCACMRNGQSRHSNLNLFGGMTKNTIVLFVSIYFGIDSAKNITEASLAHPRRRVRSGFVGAERGAERVGPDRRGARG